MHTTGNLVPICYEVLMVLGVLVCLLINVLTLNRTRKKWAENRLGPLKERIYVWPNVRSDILRTLLQLGGLAIAVQRLILMFQGNSLAVGFQSCEIATIRTCMSIAAAMVSHLNNRDRRKIVMLSVYA